jgi:DNA-binding transcriptional regulator YiaG
MNCLKCGGRLHSSVIGLYHFRESGLPNVYLKDSVTVWKCGSCGEKLIQISGLERLHDAIAYDLLKKKALLSGAEFRFLRKWVGFTADKLAATLGYKTRITVSRWENGREAITAATDHAMRLLVMRIKEQAIDRRMFEHIQIEEHFEQVAKRAKRQPRIVIDKATLKNLPFPATSRATAHHVSA